MKKSICKKCSGVAFNSIGICQDCKRGGQKKLNISENYLKPSIIKITLFINQDYIKILEKSRKIYGDSYEDRFQGRERTRELVRIRDNHTCKSCGRKWIEGTRRFDIHHLNGLCGKKSRSYDKISEMHNLITVCHRCHFNLDSFAGMRSTRKLSTLQKENLA